MNSIKTTINSSDVSLRRAAILTGIGFLISVAGVILVSLFTKGLVIPGDEAATANNIAASELLFRAGIISWFVVLIGDIVRAWAFYIYFKQVNISLALLSAWFMIIHVSVFGLTQLNLVFVSELVSGNSYLTAFEASQIHSLVNLFLTGHNFGFQIGLFFFSLHLLILGILVFRSGYIPKILGVLMIIAFIGYLVESGGKTLLPEYPEIISKILILPNLVGELALVVWLVFKGGKTSADIS